MPERCSFLAKAFHWLNNELILDKSEQIAFRKTIPRNCSSSIGIRNGGKQKSKPRQLLCISQNACFPEMRYQFDVILVVNASGNKKKHVARKIMEKNILSYLAIALIYLLLRYLRFVVTSKFLHSTAASSWRRFENINMHRQTKPERYESDMSIVNALFYLFCLQMHCCVLTMPLIYKSSCVHSRHRSLHDFFSFICLLYSVQPNIRQLFLLFFRFNVQTF